MTAQTCQRDSAGPRRASLRHGWAGIRNECIKIGDPSVPQRGAILKAILGAGVVRRVTVYADLCAGSAYIVLRPDDRGGLNPGCRQQQCANC